MSVILFQESTRRRLEDVDREHAVLLQPVGAIEQHGPHLPVGTDAIIAEEMTRRAASQAPTHLDVIVLPTLPYGRSVEHAGTPGTIDLDAAALTATLLRIGQALAAGGFRRLVLVNKHGGQTAVLETVARDIRIATGLMVFPVTLGRLGTPEHYASPDPLDIHAGHSETSIMLAIRPELVDTEALTETTGGVLDTFADMEVLTLEGAAPVAWVTEDVSATGVVGDPRAANADDGELVLAHQSERLARVIADVARFEFRSSRTSD